uniref:Uncharacterized protein n=1 Tax=Sciurus vulgaris TaxID=55149 RepID=A0A8D2AY72_SCIVU
GAPPSAQRPHLSRNCDCPFCLWELQAFLSLVLVVSLIFNIFHYIEKQQQDKMYRYSKDCIPRFDEGHTEILHLMVI